MRICLHLDPSRLLLWHLWLADALAAVPGNEVGRAFAAKTRPLPSGTRLLIEFERLAYGCGRAGAADDACAALTALPPVRPEDADAVVDLSGDGVFASGQRVLTPLFGGIAGEVGIMAAIAAGRDIAVDLHDTARPDRPWTALPAAWDRSIFTAGLNGGLSCTVGLILQALREETGCGVPGCLRPVPLASGFGAASAFSFAAEVVAMKAVRLMDILARGGRRWRIGWRMDGAVGLLDRGQANFRILDGGSDGYIADPFPFRHEGRYFIFLEKYLYGQGKGCIAVAPIGDDGRVGEARIVLDEPHHLSYPFVFEHAGQIWMIPESGAAGNVCLYLAEEFPYRWTREACLMEGIDGYDTTPLFASGKVWFFVAQRLWQSSSWDVLNIYAADGLTAPWRPHASAPVLIHAALSRPAGDFVRRSGGVVRPVQDCSNGYGGGVTFCRIDALDATRFVQTPIGRLHSGPYGCHTYNRCLGLETVDLFGRAGAEEVCVSYVAAEPEAGRIPTSEASADDEAWPAPASRSSAAS